MMSQEFWDERYRDKEYAYGLEPNAFFKAFIDSHSPAKIFLPGEGEGRNAIYAAGKGWEVTAADQSSKGRDKALKLAAENNVRIDYKLMNLTGIGPGKENYDVVALVFVHFPPEVRINIHRTLISWLKPGGWMFIEAFHKDQLGRNTGGPPVIEMLYDRHTLENDFSDMDIVSLDECIEHFKEGIYHNGEAALVRMLARKKIP